jgi:hypothetical protein
MHGRTALIAVVLLLDLDTNGTTVTFFKSQRRDIP